MGWSGFDGALGITAVVVASAEILRASFSRAENPTTTLFVGARVDCQCVKPKEGAGRRGDASLPAHAGRHGE
jgi:hypothetical protein